MEKIDVNLAANIAEKECSNKKFMAGLVEKLAEAMTHIASFNDDLDDPITKITVLGVLAEVRKDYQERVDFLTENGL